MSETEKKTYPHHVQIIDDDEIRKLVKTDDAYLFPTMCEEAIAHIKVSTSTWFSFSDKAFAEYLEYHDWQKWRGVFKPDSQVKCTCADCKSKLQWRTDMLTGGLKLSDCKLIVEADIEGDYGVGSIFAVRKEEAGTAFQIMEKAKQDFFDANMNDLGVFLSDHLGDKLRDAKINFYEVPDFDEL